MVTFDRSGASHLTASRLRSESCPRGPPRGAGPSIECRPKEKVAMARPTIVLVHGAFADASSLRGLYDALVSDDLTVIAPPNPLRGLSGGDGAHLTRVVDEVDGPVLLVGHSYGGSVITAAGTADNVVGLVYI